MPKTHEEMLEEALGPGLEKIEGQNEELKEGYLQRKEEEDEDWERIGLENWNWPE